MYESYTRQSLPDRVYRELLGTAVCVFNSNTGLIIEIILLLDSGCSWSRLIDKSAEQLQRDINKNIGSINIAICQQYRELTKKRNRILHSYRITSKDNKQLLCTKNRDSGEQFYITSQYLLDFIKENDDFSLKLDAFRKELKLSINSDKNDVG